MTTDGRCRARTKARKRCKNRAVADNRCRRHAPTGRAPKSVAPDTAEREDDLRGPNEQALAKTLGALGPTQDIDAARVEMLRSLARTVDQMPGRASLWTAYSDALKELTDDDGDSALEQAFEALRRAAEVGNT